MPVTVDGYWSIIIGTHQNNNLKPDRNIYLLNQYLKSVKCALQCIASYT